MYRVEVCKGIQRINGVPKSAVDRSPATPKTFSRMLCSRNAAPCKLRRQLNLGINNGRIRRKDARNWGIEVALLTGIYFPVAPGA
jgi:hypothetical protein